MVNGNATTSYSIDGVKNFHFSVCNTTGTKDFLADEFFIFGNDGSTIQVINIDKGALVKLTNMSGVVVTSAQADSKGTATIVLPQAKGVFILSAAGKSFKVIKK